MILSAFRCLCGWDTNLAKVLALSLRVRAPALGLVANSRMMYICFLCSSGPSEPLAPEHRPVFNKLGLGGVPKNGQQKEMPAPAPEPEEGTSIAKPLTKKQRKLAAQAERIAQARSQPQAGPSKPTPRAPRAMSKQPHNAPNPVSASVIHYFL